MDTTALDQAELTIFFDQVTYRGHGGEEKKAMTFRPYGMVRFAERGQEREYVTPITITCDIIGAEQNTGALPSALRIFLEPAPSEDEKNWMHKLGQL